jgi:hypothetical protein
MSRYKMVVKDRQTVVAVKKVPHDRKSLSRELELMSKLGEYNHPNIIQLLSSFYSRASLSRRMAWISVGI